MPPPPASLLFHPKKKPSLLKKEVKKDGDKTNSSTPEKSRPTTPRPPRPKPAEDDDLKPLPPPEGPCSEYRLMSSALNGWKYDVMKFDSRKPVDIMTWSMPVKLNRKEPRRDESSPAVAAPQAVGPMMGPDGKPVIGVDGRIVMVDAEGRPIRHTPTYTPAGEDGTREGKAKEKGPGKKRFQKKTKQVFLVPEATRQLRREERFPWVIEDALGQEVWVGKMEEVAKSETLGMFMPAANDVFKFVPAHRWYKFQKKPHFHVPTLEEAESLMTRIQKNKDPERWLLRNRNGVAPSPATSAAFKSERAGSAMPSSSSLVHSASQSLGPGGRKLKTVDNGGAGLFGDDDDDDDDENGNRKRRIKRELGAEGDLDELDFDETFADDEEKMEPEDQEDDETKELEERLKREYKNANKQREGYIDESDEEDMEDVLTGAGKTIQKTLRKLEKDGGYDDSDDEKNPYASSEEEEEEEEVPEVPTGPAIIPPKPRTSPQPQTQNGVPLTAPSTAPNGQPPTAVKSESRAGSPVPAASHSGHSMLAIRATSPKILNKLSVPNRAGSPLAGTRPGSPTATSPGPSTPTSFGAPKPSNKRKASDDPTVAGSANAAGAPSKPKKRKAITGLPAGGAEVELEDRMVIEWLKNTPEATTRDCIQYFTPYLTDESKKRKFTALVKEVAQLHKGMLVLRPEYRGEGSPAPALSPAAA